MRLEEFVRRVNVTTNTIDCWEWLGPKEAEGYGYFIENKKKYFAHRWIYEEVMEQIPWKYVIDHLCRNKSCVNVTHLEAVTSGENGRRANTRELYCKRGHKRTEASVYIRPNGARECLVCRQLRRRK